MGSTLRLLAAVVFSISSGALFAGTFSPEWEKNWNPVYQLHDSIVRRLPDGSLDIDATSKKYIYYAGGESMRAMRVAARIKFLSVPQKYSGFSVYLRWNGEVWGDRDGFWVYLRPKFRSLHMQKVVDSKLDKPFQDQVHATRPNPIPLNEWVTMRYEVVDNRIEVYLNDELCLSAEDVGPFPITSGRIAFGVVDAHVIVADLVQENLEQSDLISGVTYRYVNAPTRGDESGRVLVDGVLNSRADQAFWRMLGARPEVIFDLGQEVFITKLVLRAFSSPALNISAAEVQGGDDGQTWRTLAMLTNRDSRRADAEHEISGEVRGIARYVKLILNRPAADQDVELAEVEFSGRPPTDADRKASAAVPYNTGPPLPSALGVSGTKAYLFLESDVMRVAVHRETGVVGGFWNQEQNIQCLERLQDSYHLATCSGDTEADEYGDRVVEVRTGDAPNEITLVCINPNLADIRIHKRYSLSEDGRRLIKRTGFVNTGSAPDLFLTHRTGAIACEEFRSGGVYMGCDRGLGARLFADDVTVPRQVGALGARNTKVVLLQRYDLGWGIGQFRHRINDTWCRPLTARYYEKENHPPTYLPNGWAFGVCTLHLIPGNEQSTEVQTALYQGRQIDFYRMWRFLPETKAAWDAVQRPSWQRDLKTSVNITQPEMSADQETNMMPVRRGLQISTTGNLSYLGHIHGIWGDWFSDGIVETGVGARIDTRWLKEFIATMKGESLRLKTGVYTWAWAVHPRSHVFCEHPEWFIAQDRDGQTFNAYSNMVLNHLRLMSNPASMNELMGEFAGVMSGFGGDYFYLDGGGGGANLIDWQHLTVDYDIHWEELYRRIREAARGCGDDKGVWFNARTGPYWDIGYYEGIDRSLHAATWRDSADGLSVVKIRQVFDPDQVVVPLYWRTPTLPFYSNYCIGLGIVPSQPLGADDLLKKLPFIEAAYETRRMMWVEADLEPDWRGDSRTQIEAFALRHGSVAVISLIDHRPAGVGPAAISADVRKLGLDTSRSIYAFVFANRDIRKTWPALPEGERRRIYRETGWGLDSVARILKAEIIPAPGERIRLSVPTEPDLLRMVVLSNSPASVFSVGGLRVNFWAPKVLDAEVMCVPDGERLRIEAAAPDEGAEAIVCAPAGKELVGEGVQSVDVGDVSLAIVPLNGGQSSVWLHVVERAPSGDALHLSCPASVAAGSDLRVAVSPVVHDVSVSIWRDGVLTAVKVVTLNEGAFAIPVPVQTRVGTWQVRVRATVDGKRCYGNAEFATTGTYQPDLPPVYRPKISPQPVVMKVDTRSHGVHVIATATNSHDGYNGAHVAVADAEKLSFGGSMSFAPRSRYGYAFGGLEFEDARVVTLRVTNTIHDAWTFNRGSVSFKPQYTTTFAGLFVDYCTPEGYTHRVALGLGILNPKRTTPIPKWGRVAKPDAFVTLGDIVNQSNEATFTLDLSLWAPGDWTGRCWLTAGVHNLYPGRGVMVEVLDSVDSAKGMDILKGEDLGGLFKKKTYRVSRAISEIVLDGSLDDVAWKNANTATDFFVLGRSAVDAQKTVARILYDDEQLYIAFDCNETARGLNVSSEKLWGRDAVDIALNPSGDRATFLQVIADANGDFDQFSHSPDGRKFSWEGIQVATTKRQQGYSVEIAVPLKSMGLKPTKGLKWAGNFVRYRASDPMSTWSFMPGPAINDPERMAIFVME